MSDRAWLVLSVCLNVIGSLVLILSGHAAEAAALLIIYVLVFAVVVTAG